MRIVLFFDLPTLTEKNRKEYARFRKFLFFCSFQKRKSKHSQNIVKKQNKKLKN